MRNLDKIGLFVLLGLCVYIILFEFFRTDRSFEFVNSRTPYAVNRGFWRCFPQAKMESLEAYTTALDGTTNLHGVVFVDKDGVRRKATFNSAGDLLLLEAFEGQLKDVPLNEPVPKATVEPVPKGSTKPGSGHPGRSDWHADQNK